MRFLIAELRRISDELRSKAAVLIQKHNDNTGQTEWALVSKKDHDKVLEWYGAKKPSDETVGKTEQRVQYFKHKGGSASAFLPEELHKLKHSSWEDKGEYWTSQPLGFYWVDIRLQKEHGQNVVTYINNGKQLAKRKTPSFHEALSIADGFADDAINQQELHDNDIFD